MVKQSTQQAEKKKFNAAESLVKIYRFCAYQERAHQEVKNKLYSFGLHQDEVNEILSRLIVEGFLNEERFAKAFTGGKFRIKKWGRNKIVHALEGKGLTSRCIQSGLKEIDDPDYNKTLKALLQKKSEQTVQLDPFRKRDRIARYAIGRGYEPDLVWDLVRKLIPD